MKINLICRVFKTLLNGVVLMSQKCSLVVFSCSVVVVAKEEEEEEVGFIFFLFFSSQENTHSHKKNKEEKEEVCFFCLIFFPIFVCGVADVQAVRQGGISPRS